MRPAVLPSLLAFLAVPALAVPGTPDGDAAGVLDTVKAKAAEVAKARAAHIEAGKPSLEFRGDVAKELAFMAKRLETETRPAVRQALLVAQLYLNRVGRQTPNAALLAATFKEVPATAGAWAVDKGLLLALDGWAPAPAKAYLAEARAKQPDGDIRRGLLFEHFTVMLDTTTGNGWKPSYDALLADFPASAEAAKAKDRLASEQKTAVGAMAPAFEVVSLEDPAVKYTLASFKGKYVLLDFWASWCPDCHAEMPVLHQAWVQFQGKGLELLSLSFDRKVGHIAPYRQRPGLAMPWKHTFLESGFKNPVSEAYGVKSIPKAVLVGPDGRIVANGGELHGANLAKTLEKYLK
jgi:thiol-disulfide isomerase/thioredoxin